MTTVTTVLGLLPLIILVDPLFFSMAVIIAFGLIFGTLLTLVVLAASSCEVVPPRAAG